MIDAPSHEGVMGVPGCGILAGRSAWSFSGLLCLMARDKLALQNRDVIEC
jgi:hypothetical protein